MTCVGKDTFKQIFPVALKVFTGIPFRIDIVRISAGCSNTHCSYFLTSKLPSGREISVPVFQLTKRPAR